MKKKELERSRNFYKEMMEHYQELFDTAISELKFKNMQVDMLV
jgi:hypothetical protein